MHALLKSLAKLPTERLPKRQYETHGKIGIESAKFRWCDDDGKVGGGGGGGGVSKRSINDRKTAYKHIDGT